MQPGNRQLYARHATQPTDVNLLKVGTGGKDDWVATVVNPAPVGTTLQKGLFWLHILVWVVALILSCISNFGVAGLQAKSNDTTACGGVLNATTGTFCDDPTSSTVTIGILGGIASILGVSALLIGAAVFDATRFRTEVWLNVAIQFLTLYGSCATFFVWAKAAEKDATGAFWLGLFANLFMLYAQVLLYCTSATLDVMALPRAFIPCFAASIQLISAIAISGGDWHYPWDGRSGGSWSHPHSNEATADGTMDHFTAGQKFAAWLVPILMLVSVALMVGLRRFTRDTVTQISELGDYPFLRSLVLTPFLLSGILAVYKLSFVKADPDPTGFMFALLGMLLNFAIIGVVFVPSGAASSAVPTPNVRTSEGTLLSGKEYAPSEIVSADSAAGRAYQMQFRRA